MIGDVVVVTLICDQLVCQLLLAVEVEVTVILRTVQNLDHGDHHLTLSIELIIARGQIQTGGLQAGRGQVLGLIDNVLIAIANEVVSTLKLDKLVSLLLHTANIQIAIIKAVLDQQLTVGVEVVVISGQIQTGSHQMLLGQILVLIGNVLIAITNEVVGTVVLNQLVSGLFDVVDVQVTVNRTILWLGELHLTLGIEGIVAGGYGSAVGRNHAIGIADVVGLVLSGIADAQVTATGLEVVVITVHALQTVLSNTVLAVMQVAVDLIQTVSHRSGIVHTVLAKDVPLGRRAGALLDVTDTGIHVGIAAKVIGLTVDLSPGTDVETGAEAVAGTLLVGNPCARVHETRLLVERIGHAAHGVGALGSLVIASEVEVTVCVGLPAAGQLAVHQVVGILTDVNNTGTGDGLAAAVADDVLAGDLIIVTRSGDHSSPLHGRITDVAPGSADVAGLGAGGSLILNGVRSMDVGGALLVAVSNVHIGGVGVDLGVHPELLVGEGVQHVSLVIVHVGNDTHVDVDLQVVRPQLIGLPVGLGGVAGDLHIRVKGNDADGKLCQNSLAGLTVDAGTADGDGRGIVLLINRILSGEALCQLHVIQLPVVGTVEVDDGGNLLNGLDIGSDHIHPVNRAAQQTVQGSVGGNHVDGGGVHTRLDLDETDLDSLVAHLIADLELNAVVTVGDRQIGDLDLTVLVGAIHLNTVHVSLHGLGVDAGVVVQRSLLTGSGHALGALGHVGGDIEDVGGSGNDLSLLHLQIGAVCLVEEDLIEHRSLAVHDSVGIVNGEAIQIVGHGAVDGTVVHPQGVVDGLVEDDGDEEITGGTRGVVGVYVPLVTQQHLFLIAEVHGQVMPARLVHVVVDVLGGHHVDLGQRVVGAVAVGIVAVEALHPALDVILGDPEPEAKRTGVLNEDLLGGNTKTDVSVLLGVDGGGGQTAGLQTQRVIAVMNLSVLAGGQRQIVHEVAVRFVEISLHDGDPLVKAVLEILQNHRILAQLEQDGSLDGGIESQSSGHGTRDVSGSGGLVHGHKVQTVEVTQSVIGDIEDDIVTAEGDLLQAVLDGCLDGDAGALAVGDGDNRLLEGQIGGNHDLYGMLTHDLTVVEHLSSHRAQCAVGHEHAVLNGTHAVIGQSPGHVSGNLCLVTYGVGTHGVELHGAAGGVVVILGVQRRAGELAVSGSGGDDQNGVGGGTLAAVGQRAVDLEVLTGTLGHELGGSAAVAVRGYDTTHLDHVVGHLVVVEAGGIGRLTAVNHGDDQRTVGLDTHEGAGFKA